MDSEVIKLINWRISKWQHELDAESRIPLSRHAGRPGGSPLGCGEDCGHTFSWLAVYCCFIECSPGSQYRVQWSRRLLQSDGRAVRTVQAHLPSAMSFSHPGLRIRSRETEVSS